MLSDGAGNVNYCVESTGALLRVAEPRAPFGKGVPEAFWAAVDRLIRADGPSQRLAKRIRSRQRALSRTTTQPSWLLYLEIEELHMRRALRWVEVVARWARADGVRARRRVDRRRR